MSEQTTASKATASKATASKATASKATASKATNVQRHEGEVARSDRERLLSQRGATLWFTGLSGSGKSTIAVALEQRLHREGCLCYRLDGDNVRLGINRNLGFSAEDRSENIRRVGEICKLFVDTGVLVISSFISPYQEDRDNCRRLHEDAGMPFFEVYVNCGLAVAEARDPKGLYRRARAGEIAQFTGISAPYEAPPSPALELRTDQLSLDQEVGQLLRLLREHGICGQRAQ